MWVELLMEDLLGNVLAEREHFLVDCCTAVADEDAVLNNHESRLLLCAVYTVVIKDVFLHVSCQVSFQVLVLLLRRIFH